MLVRYFRRQSELAASVNTSNLTESFFILNICYCFLMLLCYVFLLFCYGLLLHTMDARNLRTIVCFFTLFMASVRICGGPMSHCLQQRSAVSPQYLCCSAFHGASQHPWQGEGEEMRYSDRDRATK